MSDLFNILLYEPLLKLLVFLYNFSPWNDLGIAIIVLTLIIKAFLLPLSIKSVKAQKSLKEIQPKLEEIKQKHSKDKQKQSQAIMNFYKENKVNPFASCLPILIQLPVLIAVFKVFRTIPDTLNPVSFGILNLAEPNIYIAVITAIFQYWQTKMISNKQPPTNIANKKGAKDESMMASMNKQMKFMMPMITLFIGVSMPSALLLYWLIGIFVSILEQKIIFSHSNV
ncbi:membrane protein insertase YidC [Patescibacteria group bacterium]|nr:membrane protein insertase YidC [Patescibacteria group bacterium]